MVAGGCVTWGDDSADFFVSSVSNNYKSISVSI